MGTHLLEAWRKVAAQTLLLYHGTTQVAVEAIQSHGFVPTDPESVAHVIEGRYGLPYDSVWLYKYNEFSRGRTSDSNVYLTDDRQQALRYAQIGSEVVFDALNSAIHLLKWDELVDEEGDYRPGASDDRKRWIEDETRKHYRPALITVDLPWETFVASQKVNRPRGKDFSYEEYMDLTRGSIGTVMIPSHLLESSMIKRVEFL